MGTMAFEHGGKFFESRLSYGITDRWEAGVNVYLADKAGLRPLVLVNILPGEAIKPFVTAGPLLFLFEKPAYGAGGSSGIKLDLSRNFGLFAELSVEYFFSVDESLENFNSMASAGAEARLF